MVSRVHRYPLLDDGPQSIPALSILVFGACVVEPIVRGLGARGVGAHHRLWESYRHAPLPDVVAAAGTDAVIMAPTLRHFLADATMVVEPDTPSGDIAWPRFVADGRIDEYFEACRSLVVEKVDQIVGLDVRAPILFLPFLEPKHNFLGNLLPRYDFSNPRYFVESLNRAMIERIEASLGCYVLDVNEIANIVGRARLQDDYVANVGHASFLTDPMGDPGRIYLSKRPNELWHSDEAIADFADVMAQRVIDDLAIIREPLRTKAIIIDLDDTLWRGIAVEDHKPAWQFTEGWPIGVAEALLVFKARGGMIGICSKNDEALLRPRFRDIFFHQMRLSDFASIRINFERKSENIREMLAEMNILPESTVYIDDNPRELDEVSSSIPGLRCFTPEHLDWRRKILMSPDMQVAEINVDAKLRTMSVQSNVERKALAGRQSHEEWLASLDLRQTIEVILDANHPRFARAFELLNKTNQFNTTGRRWSLHDVQDVFDHGGVLICSSLRDRLADSGMVSVLIVQNDEIVQAVLSCRAFQFGVEVEAGRFACKRILDRHGQVRARIVDTGLNATCHDYFLRLGFEKIGEFWIGHQVAPPTAFIEAVS